MNHHRGHYGGGVTLRALLTALTAVAALSAATIVPDSAAAADSLAPRAVAARSMTLRAQLGLSTGHALVARLASDRRAVLEGLHSYGIPLTEREQAQMGLRERVSAAAGRLHVALGRTVSAYAGSWVDQRHGGLIRLGFTDHVAGRLAAAKRTFGYPRWLRAFRAAYSQSELQRVRDRVLAISPQLRRRHVRVTGAGLDERANTVDVMIAGDLKAARSALARFGHAVRIERASDAPAACVERYNCFPPLRGGLVIQAESFATRCTSGFVAYRAAAPLDPATPPAVDALSTDYFLLTAGHCDPNHQGSVWLHADQVIGQITQNTWGTNDNPLDVGVIPIADEYAANWLYTRSTATPYPVRAVQPVGQDQIDDVVCISVPYVDPPAVGGWREGSKCGFITDVQQTVNTCTSGDQQDPLCETFYTLRDQVIVQIADTTPAVKPGDSGGPVFSNAPNTARGLIHGQIKDVLGRDTNKFVYGQIGYLFDQTAVPGNPAPGLPGLRVLTKPGPGGGTP